MPAELPNGFLLDLDGTLYAGEAAIPGAATTIEALRTRRTPFRLVTNTTSRSRGTLVERLRGYGFRVEAEEIVTATIAAAALLRERGYARVAPFVAPAALEDLEGTVLAGGTSGRPAAPADAVLLGDLGHGWTFALLQEAFEQAMAGAELVALSRDRYFRQGDRLVLDAGPFVAALEYATGKHAVVIGKPSPAFFAAAVTGLGLPANRSVAMVGDDLWSDVEGAQRAGLQGWLVRTGKFRADALASAGIVPDRILNSVADLA
ncbi:MAG: TIGR01458 family HAD-type hydrolase [Gemmatimonadales bacterium]